MSLRAAGEMWSLWGRTDCGDRVIMRAELRFFSLRPDWSTTLFKLEENKYSQQMGGSQIRERAKIVGNYFNLYQSIVL